MGDMMVWFYCPNCKKNIHGCFPFCPDCKEDVRDLDPYLFMEKKPRYGVDFWFENDHKKLEINSEDAEKLNTLVNSKEFKRKLYGMMMDGKDHTE